MSLPFTHYFWTLRTTDLFQKNVVRVLGSKVSWSSLVWNHLVCNAHNDIHEVVLRLFELPN